MRERPWPADLERQEDKALRDEIARAIHEYGSWWMTPLGHEESERLADAALPVVQAHAEALRKEVLEYRNALTWDTTCLNCSKLLDRCYADTQRAEEAEAALSTLRSAVAQLASEYQTRADDDPWDETSVEVVAARLRSLLPQEGPQQ